MLQCNFTPFPELTTPRLILRKITEADAPAMHRLCNDKEVMRYIPSMPERSVEDHKDWIAQVNQKAIDGTCIDFGIFLQTDPNELIGTICLWNLDNETDRAEIGYKLISKVHNQGLMSEAIAAIMAFGRKTMGVKTFEAYTLPNNTPSLKLLAKFGFKRDLDEEARVGETVLQGNVVLVASVEEK